MEYGEILFLSKSLKKNFEVVFFFVFPVSFHCLINYYSFTDACTIKCFFLFLFLFSIFFICLVGSGYCLEESFISWTRCFSGMLYSPIVVLQVILYTCTSDYIVHNCTLELKVIQYIIVHLN